MSDRYLTVGKITGLFGVSGWVRVHSYTTPRHGIIAYSSWRLTHGERAGEFPLLELSRRHSGGVLAKFSGIDDRSAAAWLLGCDVTIAPAQLKPLPPGEYYCFELIGLEVMASGGHVLGVVRELLDTGASDVLVIEGDGQRHLVPYVVGDYVKDVDLDKQRIEVNWEPGWST